jgi:hypothetical protein
MKKTNIILLFLTISSQLCCQTIVVYNATTNKELTLNDSVTITMSLDVTNIVNNLVTYDSKGNRIIDRQFYPDMNGYNFLSVLYDPVSRPVFEHTLLPSLVDVNYYIYKEVWKIRAEAPGYQPYNEGYSKYTNDITWARRPESGKYFIYLKPKKENKKLDLGV